MRKKSYIKLELCIMIIFLVSMLFFSETITNLAGFNSKWRLFLTCFVPTFMAIIPYIVYKQVNKESKNDDYKIDCFANQIILVILSVLIILMFTVFIPLLFGKELYQLVGRPYYETKIIIFRFFYYLIIVGFSEEYIFRGYFYHRFNELFDNEWVAIIISAALFGGMHYIQSQSIYLVIETFLGGIFYGYIAHKTQYGTLWVSSLSHGLYDAILMLIASFML